MGYVVQAMHVRRYFRNAYMMMRDVIDKGTWAFGLGCQSGDSGSLWTGPGGQRHVKGRCFQCVASVIGCL